MRASVLEKARRAKRAGRFVWLDIDTEKAVNAGFLEKFPVEVWPTFMIIDPVSEQAVLRWPGSATAAQIDKLLEDGERAVKPSGGESAEALLARADRAGAEGRASEARELWRAAMERGGPGWSRRPRAVESLLLSLQMGGEERACAETARALVPGLPRGPSFANAAAVGLGCALSGPAGEPWREQGVASLEPLAAEALGLDGLLADDVSGLYDVIHEARRASGDEEGARRVAGTWWDFLAAEGVRAPSAEARAALDSARVGAALALGDPARAVPAIQASERALPRDYNPPARLAVLYREMGRLDDALAASGRALQRAYGPRKLRIYELRASILEKQGDRAGARAALAEALAHAAALPASQRSEKQVGRLRQMMEGE